MIEAIYNHETGWWHNGAWVPRKDITQMLKQTGPVEERWYVYDPGHGFQDYDSEEGARKDFLAVVDAYRDEASDGWPEEVEGVMWGKIFQTVSLVPVDPPEKLADPDDWEGEEFAEAFAVEHRRL